MVGVTDNPRFLLRQPLHAITEVHGEEGLRKRFALEIGPLDKPARDRLNAALDLAARVHRDDRRVREPYINHPLRVAIRISCYYRLHDVDVLTAALLHDAVEDHPEALADGQPGDPTEAALGALARAFGDRAARLVRSVTNPRFDSGRDRDLQYREHVATSLARDPWARPIKLSDFTDNAAGIVHSRGPKLRRLAFKYLPLVPILRDVLAMPDTPLDGEARRHVQGQLDLAEERLASIIDTPAP